MFFSRKELAKIVFSSDYIYGVPTSGKSGSFDILKYKKIRDELVNNKLIKVRNLLRPHLCSYDEIRLVHDSGYVKKIQDPSFVSRMLKIDIVGHWDNYILEYYRAVTGGTLLATAYALNCRIPVFNLGGGFHHAHPDKAEGYCLINDVAIAIEKFRQKKRAIKFMVIDLDYHQGNANTLYFKSDHNVFTFSMHAESWIEVGINNNLDILVPVDCGNEEYLNVLNNNLQPIIAKFEPELIFYIAGSDAYHKDTLAGMNLTRKGMLERNKLVYDLVRSVNIPLVILAGGGYGPDSWEVYYDFIEYGLTKTVGSNAC